MKRIGFSSLSAAALLATSLWTGEPAMAQRQPGSEDLSDIPDPKPLVLLDYSNLPEGARSRSRPGEPPFLRIANNTGAPVLVVLTARALSGGEDTSRVIGELSLGAVDKRLVPITLAAMPISENSAGFVSQLLVSATVLDLTGERLGEVRAPSLYYYRDEQGVLRVDRTLINAGLVGRSMRVPEELLPLISNGDAIGTSRPGPTPRDANISPFDREIIEAMESPGPFPVATHVQVCITFPVSYTDNGGGEDSWTDDGPKLVPGVRAIVKDRNFQTLWSGFTSDGITDNNTIGCTDWLTTLDRFDWTILVLSQAKVAGNDIEAFTSADVEELDGWLLLNVDLAPGQNFIAINAETPASSALAAAAHTIHRNQGGVNSANYKIHTRAPENNYSTAVRKVNLTEDGSRQKFTVAHEIGHALMHARLSSYDDDALNYGVNASYPCDSTGSHSMRSKEYKIAAFVEGFAHFVAVDAWNDHSESNGVYVNTVGAADDAEGGARWMKENCETPHPGFSSELDWMTFFWDFHTGNGSHVGAPFDEILNIVELAGPLNTTATYYQLEWAVQQLNPDLWSDAFIAWAQWNGITD